MRLYADEEDGKRGRFITMKVSIQGTDEDVEVSEKWLRIKKLESEIQKQPEKWVKANLAGPYGERVEYLEIGVDIDRSDYDEKLDAETRELFGIYFIEEGVEKSYLVAKWLWDQMKSDVSTVVDEEVKIAMEGTGDSKKIEEVSQRYTSEGFAKMIASRISESKEG